MRAFGRTVVRTGVVAAACCSLVLMFSTPAYAGGSWLDPVLDTYSPGDTATLVGYIGPGQLGWVDDGPFPAWLRTGPASGICCRGDDDVYWQPGTAPGDVPLGFLSVEERRGYTMLRVSISFAVPASLTPDVYDVVYCNVDCTTGIGDLIGGTVYVDVAPLVPISRGWPPDDPAWQLRGEAPPPLPETEIAPAAPSNASIETEGARPPSENASAARGATSTASRGDGARAVSIAAAIVVGAALLLTPLVVRRRRRITAAPQTYSGLAATSTERAFEDTITDRHQDERDERSLLLQR